jgi:hypothetical protein
VTNLQDVIKHLPGKHSQSSHAPKKGGNDFESNAVKFVEGGKQAGAIKKIPVGSTLQLARDDSKMIVERSNGYVISGRGVDTNESKAVDLRMEDATILDIPLRQGQLF